MSSLLSVRLVLGLALASLLVLFAPSTGEAQSSPQLGSWSINFGGSNSSLTLTREGSWISLRGGGDFYICYLEASGQCEGTWTSAAGNHGAFRMNFSSDYGNGYMIVDGYWWYEGQSYADGRVLTGTFRY
jgi:hypothetical protein